jgi:outer membrane receptor protein involved in Fe transport
MMKSLVAISNGVSESGCKLLGQRRPFHNLLIVVLCLAGMASFCGRANGQVRFGSVVGVVADTSEGAIAGATVTLTNTGTNEKRTFETDGSGNYSFANVSAGLYNVDIEKSGFKHFRKENLEVNVDVVSRVNVALEVGSVTQSVVVTSEAIMMQTDSSSLGSVVNQNTVENVPVSGRNVNNLLTLVPGVQAGGSTYGTAQGNQANGSRTNSIAFGNYSIGGAFGNQSAFFVDGVPNNGPANNVNGLIPSEDIVQEFKVVTNNVSAEYGNYAGGVVNVTTKSGTNAFHGTGYDYLRNKDLNANDYFSNLASLPIAPLIQNQFGAAVGGPIKKDKTFFFFGYEGTRAHSAVLSTTTLPTAAEIGGDFSAAGLPPIYDPTTGAQFICNGVLNVICPNRIDAVSTKLLDDEYPVSKLPTTPGQNNFTVQYPSGGVQNQYDARVDQNIGSKDSLFGRFTYWKVISSPYDAWGTHTQGQGPTGLHSDDAVIGDTYTVNSSTIVDVRAFFVRIFQNEAPDSTGINLSRYGAPWGAIQSQLTGSPVTGAGSFPALTFNPTTGFGATAISATNGVGSQLYWMQNMLGTSGTVVKTIGKHQINMGANIKRTQWISEADSGPPSLTFTPTYTALSTNAGSGNPLASMLLGVPISASATNIADSGAYYWSYGLFVEDTYQVNRKLTATLGLRWDQPSVYSESKNNDIVFLPNHTASAGDVTTYTNPATGGTQTLMGLVTPVASPAWPSQREDYLHWKLFAPRVGLAYRLNNDTVIRAGYGLSYLPPALAQDGPGRTPIVLAATSVQNTLNAADVGGSTITSTVDVPLTVINQPEGRNINLASLYGVASNVNERVPGDKYAYQQQWNLAVERQLKDGTISVAYAGSKGTHLLLQGLFTSSSINDNQIPDKYLSPSTANIAGVTTNAQLVNFLTTQVANPFESVMPTPGGTVPNYQLLKPFPLYDRVNALDPNFGYSSYNSLQVSFRKKLWAGGQVVAAYTWSKLMSNTDNVTNFLDPANPIGGIISDNTNPGRERSISEYDIPQSLSFAYTLPLPFGKGRAFLHDANPVVSVLVSGWDFQGFTALSSGPPVGILENASSLQSELGMGNGGIFDSFPPLRPNFVPGCNPSVGGSRESRAANGWFNPNCFTLTTATDPNALGFGDEPRVDSRIRVDYTNNWDMALSKDTSLTERVNMQFRVQAYNMFNRTQFSGPNPTIGAGLPTVTSTARPPRNIEFSLRLSF